MLKTTLLGIIVIAAILGLSGCKSTSMPCTNSPTTDLVPKRERTIWADSWLYCEAPKLEVETWLSDVPETKGKYVLVEFWGTYCPPCRRSIPILNGFHKKFKDELVVIGISHESLDVVKNFKNKIEYFSAVDTQERVKKKLNVFGIPHVIIIEPKYGCIVWEGFPLLEGYELTEQTIEKILAVERKEKR